MFTHFQPLHHIWSLSTYLSYITQVCFFYLYFGLVFYPEVIQILENVYPGSL